jgi:hypothetical protein
MVERVEQSLDLLFALLHLAIELITVPLEFFLLLGCLDNVVGLRVLSRSLDLPTARRMLLDETFVLNPQVLHFVVPLLQLHLHLVTFFFGGLHLRDQDVLVHLDLFLALLHRHLELILPVLEAIDLISTSVDFLAKALDLELHDIVLD